MAGSFVTVVAHRVPRGESIVGPRSRCPACGAQIAAYDNVPVVSWLLLRGRARCCGAAISARYPLTELALGAALRRDRARALGRPRRDRARAGLRDDAGGGDADRPRAADHPQQDPDRRRRAGRRDRRDRRPGQPARAGDRRRGGRRAALRGGARLPAGDGPGRRQAGGDDGPLPRPQRCARRSSSRCWRGRWSGWR